VIVNSQFGEGDMKCKDSSDRIMHCMVITAK